jgi:hypothetical protein
VVAGLLLLGAGPPADELRVDDWRTFRPGPVELSTVWQPYPPAARSKTFKHPPAIVLDSGRAALSMVTDGESMRIGRSIAVDLKQTPILVWEWKPLALPVGGDVRRSIRNDQADASCSCSRA